jgi:uncharacterized protein (TIGR03437 family)
MPPLLVRLAMVTPMLGASILCAQAPDIQVVNAASYVGTTAPDSLASIFGSGLSVTTAIATLDANGQLPVNLAGTRVEVAGVPAQLSFVSPSQINFVVPTATASGTVDVVIRSANVPAKTATAFVNRSAPGVFTTDASGSGKGAILNAVTYRPAPFLVLTDNGSGDARTRLAVFGTGFRYANAVTATAQDSTGARYVLAVEFFGPAPGYFGLDQVNVVLPADLDGAGTVSLVLAADGIPAVEVTFQVDLMPAPLVQMVTLAMTPAFVNGGDSATLTVGLSGVARSGGFVVGLRSSSLSAPVPARLTVPEGKASATTLVTTVPVKTPDISAIVATAAPVVLSTQLEIDPPNSPQLVGLTVSPTSILGVRTVTGTVMLTGNVTTSGGVNVQLASDTDAVVVRNFVNVPFGKSAADFTILTKPVTLAETATLTATLGRNSVLATLNVLPPLQLAFDADSVAGGMQVNGTVTLADPAPSTGTTVILQALDPAVQPPTSVTIAAGQNSQTFTMTTLQVKITRVATIAAVSGLLRQTASVTLTPQPVPVLSSLVIVPDHVMGGSITQGTVNLTAPATAPTVVNLFCSSAAVSVPSPGSVTVPAGLSSVNFVIRTTVVPVAVIAKINASMPALPALIKSATLVVQ